MKPSLRPLIRPIFIGFLFYLFILLGHNTHLIAGDAVKIWSTILAGAIFIYVIILTVINDMKQFMLGAIGFSIASMLLGIGIPAFMIFNKVFFNEQEEKEPRSLLEKENIVFILNPQECYKVKYGTFVNGVDTITRYTKDSKDYEVLKIAGEDEKQYRIKWLDSCSYVRFLNGNSVDTFVRLGNFDNATHQMYYKPPHLHTMDEERILILTVLDTAKQYGL